MTADDDAFIRTIVDNPGQDVPRLVYADWLDDRDDPRGPFLRTEVEWAQPWKEGVRPGEDAELRAMAAGPTIEEFKRRMPYGLDSWPRSRGSLDPLWVARIARPPLGVCVDHLRFESSGPVLRRKDVDGIDRWPGVKLPTDYKAFLLNYNGGVPHRASHLSEVPRQDSLSYFSAILLYPVIPPGDQKAEDTLHGEVQRYWDDVLPGRLEEAAGFAAESWAESSGFDEHWPEKVMPVGRRTLAGGELMLGIHRTLHPLLYISAQWDDVRLTDFFCQLAGHPE